MPEDTISKPSQSAIQAADAAWHYISQRLARDTPLRSERTMMMRVIVDELKDRHHDNPQNRADATKLLVERLLKIDRTQGLFLLRLRPGPWRRKAWCQELQHSLEAHQAFTVAIHEVQQLRIEQLEELLDTLTS